MPRLAVAVLVLLSSVETISTAGQAGQAGAGAGAAVSSAPTTAEEEKGMRTATQDTMLTMHALTSALLQTFPDGIPAENEMDDDQYGLLGTKLQTARWLEILNSQLGFKDLKEGGFASALKHFELTLKYAAVRASTEDDAYGSDGGPPWWMREPGYLQMIRVIMGNAYKQNKLLERSDVPLRQAQSSSDAQPAAESAEPSPALRAAAEAAAHSQTHTLGYTVLPRQQEMIDKLPQLSTCLVPDRVPPNITHDELYDRYVSKNRPVIITRGIIDSWPANEAWSRSELLNNWGDLKVKVGDKPQNGLGPLPDAIVMTLGDYIKEAFPETEEGLGTAAPYTKYVFNTMVNHPLGDDWSIPDAIKRSTRVADNTRFQNTPHTQGVFEWLIGPAGSGSHMHIHFAAWAGLVTGRKRWVLSPPGMTQGKASNPDFKVGGMKQAPTAYDWFIDDLPSWQGP